MNNKIIEVIIFALLQKLNDEEINRILKDIGQWFEKKCGKEEGRKKFKIWYEEYRSQLSRRYDNSKEKVKIRKLRNLEVSPEDFEKTSIHERPDPKTTSPVTRSSRKKGDYSENLKKQLNNLNQREFNF